MPPLDQVIPFAMPGRPTWWRWACSPSPPPIRSRAWCLLCDVVHASPPNPHALVVPRGNAPGHMNKHAMRILTEANWRNDRTLLARFS